MYGIIGTWRMALEGAESGMKILEAGGSAADAVERVIVEVEDNPDYHSVGYSGLPNEAGEVELDAAFMDGDTLAIGAVAGMKDFKNPIKLARSLSGEEVNNFLVGKGAEQYGHVKGFERKNMLTEYSREKYLEKKKTIDLDLKAYDGHDTVGVVGLDKMGSIVVGTSTSGLFMKKPGRVGDSPVAGCGFYTDSDIGGCVATGLGEDIMKASVSYEVVRLMGEGLSPQEASEKAVFSTTEKLVRKTGKFRDISVVSMDNKGNWGAATNIGHFSFVVGNTKDDLKVYIVKNEEGELVFSEPDKKWIATHTE